MLAKCANPTCSSHFRYLRDGKLFRFEMALQSERDTESLDDTAFPKKSPHKVEHFWLCSECAAQMTLRREGHHGVAVVPLHPHLHRAASA